MAARRGTAAVQGAVALAFAGLRRVPRCGHRCPDPVRASHRPGRGGLRRRPDVRHAVVPQRLRRRLGRQRNSGIGGRPGGSKRRRGEERKDPTLEVTDLQATETGGTYPRRDRQDFDQDDAYGREDSVFGQRPETAAESTSVYEPQPLPDDTGQYGVYSDAAYAAATDPAYAASAQAQGQDPLGQNFAYDAYSGYDQQQYGYDAGQQQYAAYSDPYTGTQPYDAASYGQPYDASQQQYGQQGYTQDPYATGGYGSETPSGGVWVPQQRNTEDPYGGELPPEQSYPYDGNGSQQQRQRAAQRRVRRAVSVLSRAQSAPYAPAPAARTFIASPGSPAPPR